MLTYAIDTTYLENDTVLVIDIASTDDIDSEVDSTLKYDLIGSIDDAKFEIDSITGAITFVSSPDHENPTDSGTDNVYNIEIAVCDIYEKCDTQAIAITVQGVNEQPSAVDDIATTDEDVTIIIDVQGNDSDPEDSTLVTTILEDVNNGTTTILGQDSIQYTPTANFSGKDT